MLHSHAVVLCAADFIALDVESESVALMIFVVPMAFRYGKRPEFAPWLWPATVARHPPTDALGHVRP